MNLAKYLADLIKRTNGWRRFVTERPSVLCEGGNRVDRAQCLLRFVIERPSVLAEPEDEAERSRCPLCNWGPLLGEAAATTERCRFCGWAVADRGGVFQEKLSKLIHRALLQDPKLVARVKVGTLLPDDVVCRVFTGPLEWLGEHWRRAGKPAGRPFEAARHWAIVTAIELLTQTHSLCPAQGGERVFDTETKAPRPARPGELIRIHQGWELGLTFTEAVRLLSGEAFPPGPVPPRRDRMPRPAHRGETLNAIGEDLQKRLGYPARREEIIRSMCWARKQRTSAPARWQGQQVRARGTVA